MREGEPSRTALGAAAHRAEHQQLDRPLIFTDPLAVSMLGDYPEAFHEQPEEQTRLRIFIAVRHRFAEDSLAAAYARGTRQAVVLGAGLDTFAYRNPWPELLIWEVDHPSTGAWKRERLAAVGVEVPETVRYVGVDFESESFLERLVDAGLDPAEPTFFLWLGVVPYLSHAAVVATLRAIASIPGGEVVFDHPAPVDEVPEWARAGRERLAARVAAIGEPFSPGWSSAEIHRVLAQAGFDDIEDVGRNEIRQRYLGLPPAERTEGGGHVVRARVTA